MGVELYSTGPHQKCTYPSTGAGKQPPSPLVGGGWLIVWLIVYFLVVSQQRLCVVGTFHTHPPQLTTITTQTTLTKLLSYALSWPVLKVLRVLSWFGKYVVVWLSRRALVVVLCVCVTRPITNKPQPNNNHTKSAPKFTKSSTHRPVTHPVCSIESLSVAINQPLTATYRLASNPILWPEPSICPLSSLLRKLILLLHEVRGCQQGFKTLGVKLESMNGKPHT